MLKINDIISMIKDIHKSNLMLENFFDVIITTVFFSFLCNFFSKVGLSFIVVSGILYLFDIATGFVLLTLFAPSILVLANLPIAYIKNITKDIKQYKNGNKINEINYIEKSNAKNKAIFNYSNNISSYKERNLVRVRKR